MPPDQEQPPAGGFSPELESALRAAAPSDFLPGLENLDDGAGLLELDKPEVVKRYTAERLERDTARRAGIISALAEGIGMHRIARAYHVSVHTVIALRERCPALVATEKKRLAQIARAGAALCLERYVDAVNGGGVKPESLPIGIGILIEKAQLLEGEPTMIGEQIQRPRVTPENFDAWLESLKRAQPVSAGPDGDKRAAELELPSSPPAAQVHAGQDPSAGGAQVLRLDGQSTAPERETGDLLQDPLQKPAGSEPSSAAPADPPAPPDPAARAKGGGGGRATRGGATERLERSHKIF